MEDNIEEIITGDELKNLSDYLDGSNDNVNVDDIKNMMDKIFEDDPNIDEEFSNNNNSFNSKVPLQDPLADEPILPKQLQPVSADEANSILDTKQEEEKLELAGYVYQKKLKLRIFRAWQQFVAMKRQHEEQRRKAVRHHYLQRLKKSFALWQKAYKTKNNIVLQVAIDRWKLFVTQSRRVRQKEEAAERFHNRKILLWTFKSWRVYHLRKKEAAMKFSLSVQTWAICLQWKTFRAWLRYYKAKKFKVQRELEAKKLYRKRLIQKGISQWLIVATDMQEKRTAAVVQREAERAARIYRLVIHIAHHWRRVTINHRAIRPQYSKADTTPRLPKIDIEAPFFGSFMPTSQPPISISPPQHTIVQPKKVYEIEKPTIPNNKITLSQSTDSSFEITPRSITSAPIAISSQRKAPRIPSYILPNADKPKIELPPQDTKGSAPSSVNNSFSKTSNYPPLPDTKRQRPAAKLEQLQAISRNIKNHNLSYDTGSDTSNVKPLSISAFDIKKDEFDPNIEIAQIERRLKFFADQKSQVERYRLEYRQLLETLSVYQQTNNTEEIKKLETRAQFYLNEIDKYKTTRESRGQEIKTLAARIEELRRM